MDADQGRVDTQTRPRRQPRRGDKTGEAMTTLNDILETTTLEKVAGGFLFTEGPLWHPDGFCYFVDLKSNLLYRMKFGEKPVKIRDTDEGNGTTFDLQGRLLNCEGGARRVYRIEHDGSITTVASHFEGKRLSRPNDVICRSDGTLYFTDPSYRVPVEQRELGQAGVYRIGLDGSISEVLKIEYPNGLAFSKDERTLYVANTRWTQYIAAFELDSAGTVIRRRLFADMSHDEGGVNGVPDGMKVDEAGRVFCTGTRGVWVFEPSGALIGIIETPEICANIAFIGDDLKTLMLTATTSIYTLRVKTPGLAHPWYKTRRQ
jgi:gluconolactonase